MSHEIPLESMSLVLETTRGTAITPPTKRLNMAGTLTPMKEIYYPPDEVGTLSDVQRSEIVRKWGEWAAEGALDVLTLPTLLNMTLAVVTSPSTPANAVLTRLWTFTRNITSDTIKASTWYWGDANHTKMYQGAFGMLQELVIASDATGTEGSTMSASGISQFPTDVTPPALPAISLSPLIVPGRMQLWIDLASGTMGTTEITGRVLGATHTIPTGVVPKYPATGPAGGITYTVIGRAKSHATTHLVLDMVDQAQFDMYKNGDLVKVRVRHNGPVIEVIETPATTFYNYVEVDLVGRFAGFGWGDYETNRVMEIDIEHEYHSSLVSDTTVRVQSNQTAL